MTHLERLAIGDVLEIVPPRYSDRRGYFSEVFKRSDLEAQGVSIDWVQENHSFSAGIGTVRGLHYQAPPHAQAKLVRVLRGAIFDVAVDIRRGSPSYGKWVAAELSAEKWNQLLIPTGFAHGFLALTSDVEVLYKVSAGYAPECEGTLRWDDPDLAIEWPLADTAILSAKDANGLNFRHFLSPFTYGAA
ncbi:MAG: dTDP-4-dehydrorhamnose 3,5-epimerase [Sphingomonas sp.]|uniref:dTDP-4-dehydrorhamnose 3,5-epimerase n=1 Tax=Sphingomonas sp. TaxID=28214 RepID=UPI001B0D1DC6|nr:dTDP-4-dehydrorhamnose 3,5-epimerase [Sphingomonas sp.]MBO9623879.1 dTDP-4-dehydrorhamnose 3,5-epimerase [Sphingomonas sp.]